MTHMIQRSTSIELSMVQALAACAAAHEREQRYNQAAKLWHQVATRHPNYREGDYARHRRDFCSHAAERGWR